MSSLTASPVTSPRGNHLGKSLFAHILAFLLLLWIEIRRSQGYWLLPLMIGFGIFTASVAPIPDPVVWTYVNRAILESYVLVGALTAALGAWLAGRERRRKTGQLMDSTPGSGVQRDLLAFGATTCWGLLGYGGVAAWFGGQAMLRATWGGPDFALIGVGAVVVVMLAALGVLVGRLVPGRYGPLVALVLAVGLTIVSQTLNIERANGTTQNPVKFLLPFGLTEGVYVGDFYRFRDSLVMEVIVWVLALTALLLAVIALRRQRSLVTGIALASTVGLATVAAAPLVGKGDNWGPEVYAPVAYTPVCEMREGFEVCVHPAYEGELDEAATSVAALFGPVQGLEGVPSRWEQSDSMMPFHEGPSSGGFYAPGLEKYLLEMVASLFPAQGGGLFAPRPASQLVIMNWLVTQSGLNVEADWDMWGWPAEALVDTQFAGDAPVEFGSDESELASIQAGMDAAQSRFAALTPDQQRDWLEANWDALRAGEIGLDEMP